jgi:hypothetical protein
VLSLRDTGRLERRPGVRMVTERLNHGYQFMPPEEDQLAVAEVVSECAERLWP